MDHKAKRFAALVASTLVAGCAVEVPKSALPAFRLTPPQDTGEVVKLGNDQVDLRHR